MKALIICGALIALAAPAAAEVRPAKGQPDALETSVRFSDLDLNRVAGADAVLARIDHAAHEVCGEAPSPRELRKAQRYRGCVAAAKDAAVFTLGAPLVTARHNGRVTATLAAR